MKTEEKILKQVEILLSKEPRLIEISQFKKIIFAGDTHGDLEISKKVISDYLKPENIIVFLGDYVDRGPFSKKTLDFLLETKVKNPNQIYLLQGNHEGHHILKFSPADFWERLDKKEYQKYSSVVEKFPLAVITKDIIALHGALPDVKSIKEINQIKLGSEEWLQITWGDFSEVKGEYLGKDPFTGRPQFGRDYFLKLMKRFKKKVLIRSHQPDTPQFIFDDRCLTIFTSSAYPRERTIAILDFKKTTTHPPPSRPRRAPIKTAKDLEIIKI
ncbi:serine/threonine protein phosphatase [Patescibacteria group bacterium]|nr:serine/threonine protein phosphatase [Patescibacteria group bacterium]